MDLDATMRYAEVQELSSLAAGAEHPAAAITLGVAFRRPPGVCPAGSDEWAGSFGHPDPRSGQGSTWGEGSRSTDDADALRVLRGHHLLPEDRCHQGSVHSDHATVSKGREVNSGHVALGAGQCLRAQSHAS